VRPLRGRAVTLKWQQATKNLTLEGADKAAETLNSSNYNIVWLIALIDLQNAGTLKMGGRTASITDNDLKFPFPVICGGP
jgi:hypothetical protein